MAAGLIGLMVGVLLSVVTMYLTQRLPVAAPRLADSAPTTSGAGGLTTSTAAGTDDAAPTTAPARTVRPDPASVPSAGLSSVGSAEVPSLLTATLLTPSSGSRTEGAVVVSGRLSRRLTSKEFLRIVVQSEEAGRYYPSGRRVAPTSSNTFTSVAYVGGSRSSQQKFVIRLLKVDASTDALFDQYLKQSSETKSYTGLPSPHEGTELASVLVVRE